MHLSLYLLAGVLKKAAWVFGILLIVFGVLFFFDVSRPDRRSGTGTLRYCQFEGGFWGIDVDDGGVYDISSPRGSYFPEEFHVDGLRVGFIGYLLEPITHTVTKLTLIDIWKI